MNSSSSSGAQRDSFPPRGRMDTLELKLPIVENGRKIYAYGKSSK